MKKLVIKAESTEHFLAWSKSLATMVDQGHPIPETCEFCYQDPEELLATFTSPRRNLLTLITQKAGTVEDIAMRAGRDLASVQQDIERLAEAGVLVIGQGLVHAIAEEVVFESMPQVATAS